MIWFRKYLKVVGIVVLFLLLASIFIIGRIIDGRLAQGLVQQVNEKQTDKTFIALSRIGGVDWEVGTLRLFFKGTKIGDSNLYLVGGYTDTDKIEQEVKVFVGRIGETGRIHLTGKFLDKDRDELLSKDVEFEEVTNVIKEGDQIQVDFLVNVPDYEKVVKETTLCKDLPSMCVLGEMTLPFQASYGGFWYKHEPLPSGMALNAITVSKL